MPETEPVFSKEYQTGTQTASTSDEGDLQVPEAVTSSLEIEIDRYGISKPKRSKIRGTIIHP